jgi:hypothetical protein
MPISPLTSVGAIVAGSAAARVVDRLADSASSFIELLRGHPRQLKPASPPDPDGTAENDALGTLKQSLVGFEQLLRQRLAAERLTTSLRFQLQSDGRGGIRVVGGHPKGALLERAINADPTLTAAFHSISATYGLMTATQRHRQFTDQCWNNPILGAEELSRAALPTAPTFTLTVNGDDIELDLAQP